MMDFELEEMRRQMAILKEKLDKQEIVNDQLMRKAVGRKLRRLRNTRWRQLIIVLVGLVYMPILFYHLQIGLWFTLVTVFFFCFAALYDIYYTRGLNDSDLQNKRLLEIKEKVIRMKRMNARWLWFGIPFVIVWICTFFWLVYNKSAVPSEAAHGIAIGGLVGGCIGAVIGTVIYRRQQRSADELIDEIEELTK